MDHWNQGRPAPFPPPEGRPSSTVGKGPAIGEQAVWDLIAQQFDFPRWPILYQIESAGPKTYLLVGKIYASYVAGHDSELQPFSDILGLSSNDVKNIVISAIF